MKWMAGAGLVLMGTSSCAIWSATTDDGGAARTAEQLAILAVSEDDGVAGLAIEELRALGPTGHRALMTAHVDAIERLRSAPVRDEESDRLRRAIDSVSAQRDGHASGLYWHTELADAQLEAARTGRPILSLRLLGRLDEEMSCANSRYFRIVLYSDPSVARVLAGDYVLHWSTERPAPRITIDMGDGRQIVRTITGNSVHYLLDEEGRPLDAIVGLYSPRGFLSALEDAAPAVRDCALLESDAFSSCLAAHHERRNASMQTQWASLRPTVASLSAFDRARGALPVATVDVAPSAIEAMRLTVGKSRVELRPLLMLQRGGPGRLDAERAATDAEPDWAELGRARGHAAPMAAQSRALLRLKTGRTRIDALARSLAESAVADGERNELLFHYRVHEWFSERLDTTADFDTLNAAIYTELLRTPASDPWLGLRADDLYDGLEVVDAPR